MEESRELLKRQGLGLAAISYDSVPVLENFARRKGITFPLLSDTESAIIHSFGILNEAVPKDNMAYGIPQPVSYIVDPDGVVVSRHFEEDYRQRLTVGNILTETLDLRTGAAKTVTENARLKLTASSSNAVVRPGERIRLILDIELKPRMHVYAPGVQGYIPIEWTMKNSGGGEALAAEYPKSTMLHLPAIGETVPVYEKRFSISREIVLAPAAKLRPLVDGSGNVSIEGSFRYQACDDRVCYIPETIPLRWMLKYQDLETERAPPELRRKAPEQ